MSKPDILQINLSSGDGTLSSATALPTATGQPDQCFSPTLKSRTDYRLHDDTNVPMQRQSEGESNRENSGAA